MMWNIKPTVFCSSQNKWKGETQITKTMTLMNVKNSRLTPTTWWQGKETKAIPAIDSYCSSMFSTTVTSLFKEDCPVGIANLPWDL